MERERETEDEDGAGVGGRQRWSQEGSVMLMVSPTTMKMMVGWWVSEVEVVAEWRWAEVEVEVVSEMEVLAEEVVSAGGRRGEDV
ncbi:hypothetical protein Hdeb2414_s0747g00942691 [Helianthus debilis subsp. tardiflorus]